MHFLFAFAGLALLALTTNGVAAATIEIAAKFADVPAGTEAPAKPELLAKIKGVEVLSAPRVAAISGHEAAIEVTQILLAPDGSEIPLGISLSIKATLNEKGAIVFSGKATDRFKHGQRGGETLTVLACVAREIYFKGTAANGASIVLNAGPSTLSSAKSDGATQVKSRELVIYLTFKKITPEPAKKPAPKSKPKPSKKKTA